MTENTTEHYRTKLNGMGLDDSVIDECLALFRQQATAFSASTFITFAVRHHRLNKQSLPREPEEGVAAKIGSSNRQQEDRSALESLPTVVDQEWLPDVATIQHLQTLGFSSETIFGQIPGFIFYYNSRLDNPNRYSVDMQFVYHMQYVQHKALTEQTEMMEQDMQRRMRDSASKMRQGWRPCERTFAILQDTHFVPKLIAIGYVDEFVLYWEERQELPQGGSWKTAFIQYSVIRYEKEEKKWRSQQRKWKSQPRQNQLI